MRRRGAKRRRGGVRGGPSLPAKEGGTDRAGDSGRHPVGKAPRIRPDDGVPHLFEDGFPCGALSPPADSPGRPAVRAVPGLDPPEYVAWKEDSELLAAFQETLARDPARIRIAGALSEARRLRLYEGLVRNRLHDLQLKRWVRSGVLSKAWLGSGEEAVTVGACHALGPGDIVGPMIRNAGACHERGMPLAAMFRGALGAEDGPARGRDLHFGDPERGVVAPISMVGSLVPVCAGMALAFRLRGEKRVALTWVGDGTLATAGFHEGMACAAALCAPLVVVIQNNRIALGTPLTGDAAARLRHLGPAYGVPVFEADGNNVLDVFAATRLARERVIRSRRPAFVLAHTFRMGGHATHDEGESRKILPAALFLHYGRRDPVRLYRAFLHRGGAAGAPVPDAVLGAAERRVESEVAAAEKEALGSRRSVGAAPSGAGEGVFAQPRGRTAAGK